MLGSGIPIGQGLFTPGQGQRMREKLLGNIVAPDPTSQSNFYNKLNLFHDGTPNISVLYQPFQSSRLATGIASTTDNGNGTATVCRNYVSSNYRFQPGFDYEFPEEDSPNFTAFNTTQTPLIVSPRFNCPVKILQLSNDIGEAPTVCRGVYCVEESFLFGKKYSTQILGSMNMTEEDLDAIQVKDPDLYAKLMSQYYHILKKTTTSGAEVQQIIFKQ
jgi:hypothetical protein